MISLKLDEPEIIKHLGGVLLDTLRPLQFIPGHIILFQIIVADAAQQGISGLFGIKLHGLDEVFIRLFIALLFEMLVAKARISFSQVSLEDRVERKEQV